MIFLPILPLFCKKELETIASGNIYHFTLLHFIYSKKDHIAPMLKHMYIVQIQLHHYMQILQQWTLENHTLSFIIKFFLLDYKIYYQQGPFMSCFICHMDQFETIYCHKGHFCNKICYRDHLCNNLLKDHFYSIIFLQHNFNIYP